MGNARAGADQKNLGGSASAEALFAAMKLGVIVIPATMGSMSSPDPVALAPFTICRNVGR